MKLIQGISDQPKQQITIGLDGGTNAVWSLTYKALQKGWFYDLTWNGAAICKGQRLVSSPNILRQFINKVPFGIAVLTEGDVEPTAINDLNNGVTTLYLLQGDDLSRVETLAFGAPEGQLQPVSVSPDGTPTIVPPSSWGPAGGDLRGTYPNPSVGAVHTADGIQLLLNLIADGEYLRRVGSQLIGDVPGGAGDVVGPASSVDGYLAVFNGVTGKVIKSGGAVPTSLPPSGTAGGQLGDTYPNPTVRGLRETSGPTQLALGAVADGSYLKRVGATLVGSVPPGGGDVVGPSSSVDGYLAVFNGTSGKLLKSGGNLTDASLNFVLNSLLANTNQANRFSYPPELGYPTFGAITVNISNNNRAYIGLTANAVIALSGISDIAVFWLDLKNTTASAITLTWPAWTLANGVTLPTTLAAGATLALTLRASSNTIGSVIVVYAGTGSPTFNVKDYGATGDGSTDDYAAIMLAVAAGIATAKPFCLYFPYGIYKCSARITITLANNGQSLMIRGDGIGVSQVFFSNSGSACGILVNRAPSGGYYTTDAPWTGIDFSIVCSGTTSEYAIKLNMSAGTDSGSLASRFYRVGFFRDSNSSTHQWGKAIWLENWSNVVIDGCIFPSNDIGIYIHGSNASTSGFRVSNCYFQGGTYGIQGDGVGTVNNRLEELICVNCTFVLPSEAIHWVNSNTGGVFQVFGGHMNVTSKGIYVRGVNGVVANGVNIFNSGGAFTAIDLADGESGAISGCSIAGGNVGGSTTGVSITGTSNRWTVHDTDISGCATAVTFGASVTNSLCHDMTCTDGGAFTDSGSTGSNRMGNVGLITAVPLLAGAASQTIDIDITSFHFGRKPTGGKGTPNGGGALPNYITAAYDFDSGSSTKTNARYVIYTTNGSALPSGSYRMGFDFFP